MSDSVSPLIREILDGDHLPLSGVAKRIPGYRGGEAASPSTVWRWVNTGARATDGRVVKLDAVRLGNRWLTSTAAVGRFMAALTSADTSPEPRPTKKTRTPEQRRKAAEDASRRLAAAGA